MNSSVLGTGFETGDVNTPSDIAFGPDRSLYVSMFSEDRILRISPDCNTNGLSDFEDLLTGTSFDCNTNSIPDECEADFDDDGLIDDCDPDIDDDTVPNVDDACNYTLMQSIVNGRVILDPISSLYGTIRGDFDGDCDCDLADYAIFIEDFTGPNG